MHGIRTPPAPSAPPSPPADETTVLVSERSKTHGDFAYTALVAEELHAAFWSRSGTRMSAAKRHALNMIFTKLARIASGDPNHVDHWDDIAGYAKLAAGSTRG